METKGFCFYKATNGIKRDTLGFPCVTHCTLAHWTDDAGLIEFLTQNIDYVRAKPVNIPIMRKIRFERSPKPSKAEKAAAGKSGFVPVAARWVIERSNAWMERCKSLVKNFEPTLSHATTQLNVCFVRLMLKRLAVAA